MKKIILASQSPRRRELLAMLGLPFDIMASSREEIVTSKEPAAVTEELSAQKAEDIAGRVPDGIVIGADTVVACDGEILGKPADEAEAADMLNRLQGKSHMVYTGVTVLEMQGGQKVNCHTFSEGTRVRVAAMSREEIQAYIATGEPFDKAGGYGIQGVFGKFIEGIDGDFYNVMGLPLHRVYRLLSGYRLSDCRQQPMTEAGGENTG